MIQKIEIKSKCRDDWGENIEECRRQKYLKEDVNKPAGRKMKGTLIVC